MFAQQERWEEEFNRRVNLLDDSEVGFFPFGGDSYDFSEENCKKFIRELLDKSNK